MAKRTNRVAAGLGLGGSGGTPEESEGRQATREVAQASLAGDIAGKRQREVIMGREPDDMAVERLLAQRGQHLMRAAVALTGSRADLDRPHPLADAELATYAERYVQTLPFANDSSLVAIEVQKAIRVLLESAPEGMPPGDIGIALAHGEHVKEVHDLHVWELAPGHPILTAHVLVAVEKGQSDLVGHVLSFSSFIRKCLWFHFETHTKLEGSEEELSNRLALARTKVLGELARFDIKRKRRFETLRNRLIPLKKMTSMRSSRLPDFWVIFEAF